MFGYIRLKHDINVARITNGLQGVLPHSAGDKDCGAETCIKKSVLPKDDLASP